MTYKTWDEGKEVSVAAPEIDFWTDLMGLPGGNSGFALTHATFTATNTTTAYDGDPVVLNSTSNFILGHENECPGFYTIFTRSLNLSLGRRPGRLVPWAFRYSPTRLKKKKVKYLQSLFNVRFT